MLVKTKQFFITVCLSVCNHFDFFSSLVHYEWLMLCIHENVLKFLYWGSDVLKFWLKWGLAMFLRCSYFFPNLSLDVLIDLVLNQKNACTTVLCCTYSPVHCVFERWAEANKLHFCFWIFSSSKIFWGTCGSTCQNSCF